MRTIAIDDPGVCQSVSLSVSVNRAGCEKRLNGSTSCMGWRLSDAVESNHMSRNIICVKCQISMSIRIADCKTKKEHALKWCVGMHQVQCQPASARTPNGPQVCITVALSQTDRQTEWAKKFWRLRKLTRSSAIADKPPDAAVWWLTAIYWTDFSTFTYLSPVWRAQWKGSPRAIGFIFDMGRPKLERPGCNQAKVAWWLTQ